MDEDQDKKLIDTIDGIIQTTDSFKVLVIRVILIAFLSITGGLITIMLNNQQSIVNAVFYPKKEEDQVLTGKDILTLRDVVRVSWALKRIEKPNDIVLGIEGFNSSGVRDVYWISDEELFKTRGKGDYLILDDTYVYLRGYISTYNSCVDSRSLVKNEDLYHYYACPITLGNSNRVVGMAWGQFNVENYDKREIIAIQKQIKEIAELLKTGDK